MILLINIDTNTVEIFQKDILHLYPQVQEGWESGRKSGKIIFSRAILMWSELYFNWHHCNKVETFFKPNLSKFCLVTRKSRN